jgi:two-component system sensor histidine kinase DesK
MSADTVARVRSRTVWLRLGWALPWLLFLVFPIVDLADTPRPVAVRVLAAVALAVFSVAYVAVFSHLFGPGWGDARQELVAVMVLGAALPSWLGSQWSGLLIYVCAAAAARLSERWMWPVVVAAAALCAAVLGVPVLVDGMFILPVLCVLTAFALRGTRYLVSVNAELAEARDELARNAVAEERLRFARDLHDLLGHSLSMIALKTELAGRLIAVDPDRARAEIADVEAAARGALAEVRDAVSGYRRVSLRQALVEARSALSAAGITLRAPASVEPLPESVDSVLGWVVREATTNVLRHSGARSVTVQLSSAADVVTLATTDDGRGPAGGAGSGLAGLAERVEALGGRLEAGAAPGRGFRVTAHLPVTVPTAPTTAGAR